MLSAAAEVWPDLDGEFSPTPYPITPGHEFSGTVVAVAGDVRMNLPVGAKVAVDPRCTAVTVKTAFPCAAANIQA
jgi:D-arabinose 1-dehydrogenase-like Zn-dependent alcohol dehydrogenase